MPPKIAHITPVYPPYAGGIGVAAAMMVNGLRQRGWDVDIFTPAMPGNSSQPPLKLRGGAGGVMNDGVVHLKPLARIGNAALVPQLRKIKGYDIVHLHLPFFGGAEWLIRNSKFQIPNSKFIVQYHHDADASGLKGAIFKTYDRLILPRILKRADKVIVSTMDYARHSRVARFIDERFVEIPFGIDSNRFKPADERRKTKDESFTILFAGSLDNAHWFKGLDVLLKALAEIKQKSGKNTANLPRWHCQVIGDGDLRPWYEKMTQKYGLDDEVEFLGKVSHEELPQYYQQADCFVFPSVSRAEAFGLVVLEAMASGLPVIISDLPGVRTLVQRKASLTNEIVGGEEGTQCGYTIPIGDVHALADRLRLLMNDQALRQRMDENARNRVLEHYTLDKMIDRIEKLY